MKIVVLRLLLHPFSESISIVIYIYFYLGGTQWVGKNIEIYGNSNRSKKINQAQIYFLIKTSKCTRRERR